jgi:hypothetical protein
MLMKPSSGFCLLTCTPRSQIRIHGDLSSIILSWESQIIQFYFSRSRIKGILLNCMFHFFLHNKYPLANRDALIFIDEWLCENNSYPFYTNQNKEQIVK